VTTESKDHFITTPSGLSYAGNHLIVDFWGARDLDDRFALETALIEAATEAGATILHLHLHTFGDGGGVSGVLVLAESHISVHTWPEKGFAAFDIFMCGDARPDAALAVLKGHLAPARIVSASHKRGVV
jgi:S-adenosylmethionine decarboxylase